MKAINIHFIFASLFLVLFCSIIADAGQKDPAETHESTPSKQTKDCIECHKTVTPGIVEDWLSSRHSKVTPSEAIKKPALERRISTDKLATDSSENVVGCYECHSQNPQNHKDNFEHFGFRINVVVTPNDCNTCHPVEVKQFSESKKAHAIKNLGNNPLYHTLVKTVTGVKKYEKGKILAGEPSDETLNETCFGCHGTKVEVKGMKTVPTEMGDISVPVLLNWPNQGVGRENPDGSLGACTACHPRHAFSIEVARKPYTCSQCHLEPDTPAWDVYKESKHGNIFFSQYHEGDFNSVPWTIGKDFKSPTCATCHNSLVVSTDKSVIAERSHDFGSRLWVRLFGLIYSHPQPKSGNTTIIKNKDGQTLPTSFSGEFASDYLINKEEQDKRQDSMRKICNGCHGTSWINGHFTKLESTVRETNEMTLAATKIMNEAWEKGLEDKTNPFDESIEQLWIKQWLFYSNSVRYSSAMSGPDYASFKNGWWELTNNLNKMKDLLDSKSKTKEKIDISPVEIKK